MNGHDLAAIWAGVKAAGAVLAASAAGLIAQVELPELTPAGNLGVLGALALLVGRYTVRQLEDYRSDLRAERARSAHLQDELEKSEAHRREVIDYAHRLRLWAMSAGATTGELPAVPAPPKPSADPAA